MKKFRTWARPNNCQHSSMGTATDHVALGQKVFCEDCGRVLARLSYGETMRAQAGFRLTDALNERLALVAFEVPRRRRARKAVKRMVLA